ncbi:hypothetical protein [Buttiauxella sp. S19-1]|uniref:hypothetical protein n=1 Tax=Buttiauxella sp. S19-1 TaxID=941430 RepID=UPI001EDA4A10|nr:hypothetical protein [Buttiauxella sp. S19-1]
MTSKLDAILNRAVNLRPDQAALLTLQSDVLKFRHNLHVPEDAVVYQCGCCRRIVDIQEMVANPCTSDGLSHYCRPCTTVKFQGAPMPVIHKFQDAHRIAAGATCAITGAEGNLVPFFYTFDISKPVFYLRRDFQDIFIQRFSYRLVGYDKTKLKTEPEKHPVCRYPATWFTIPYRQIDNIRHVLALVRLINKTRPDKPTERKKGEEIEAFLKHCILPEIPSMSVFPTFRPYTKQAATDAA